MEDTEIDKMTTRLATELKDLLSKHISKFSDDEYEQAISSCLVALARETGEIRWLTVETSKVDVDKFDELFLNCMARRFAEKEKQFGGKAH